MSAPMSKAARQHLIASVIERNPIRSQGELVELLNERGIVATASTVSRDLTELDDQVAVRTASQLIDSVVQRKLARLAIGYKDRQEVDHEITLPD